MSKRAVPEEVAVSRSDPIYMAHGYLTKVPVTAIEPFIAAFTNAGDVVLDVFAGSGMTGVAAALLGRRSYLVDISELGGHIGRNYLNVVDGDALRAAAAFAIAAADVRLQHPYSVMCATCGEAGTLSRRTWSVLIECPTCREPVNFYECLEQAGWSKADMTCPSCRRRIALRGARRIGEAPVVDTLSSACSSTFLEQPPSGTPTVPVEGLVWPTQEIGSDRQMFQASALGKHDLLTVADFFSERNRAALAALRDAVREVPDAKVRDKLMFGFTAILARASKRYQWSRQRPLNAANQNYYIAPVFFEWNVFDLFSRKIEAVIRADDYIRTTLRHRAIESLPESTYVIASAEELSLADESVDYVFTDPPFGSNIFYSDMNLFQESWLGRLTDHRREAVIDRSGNETTRRSIGRYEDLLGAAFNECWRVLRPNAWLSVVFSNSSGEIWQLLRRSLAAAGFVIEANGISLLDKGQRSVKGLASGVENTVTVDLIISVQKRVGVVASTLGPPAESLETILDRLLASSTFRTPSHVYLGLVRECLRHHWSIDEFGFSDVVTALRQRGLKIDAATGRFIEATGAQTSIWKE